MNSVAEKSPEMQAQADDFREWLTIEQAIASLKHFECQQNPKELEAMLSFVDGKSSLLEIGSNYGGTLWRMAKVLAPKSKVVSVDLPSDTHAIVRPVVSLKANCQKIANLGHDVELILGDSHRKEIIERVRQWAPYDFIFIDGDHSYEGVKRDWLDYGPMGKIVGFHDTNGGEAGCVKFWNELKADGSHNMRDIHYPQYIEDLGQWMNLGIGIVFRES